MNRMIKTLSLTLAALPVVVLAQSNEAFIEKSKIVGGGNVLRLYGLPGKDAEGKINYWDTTITLEIGPSGKPTGRSLTESVRQAKPKSTEFVPGTYADANGSHSCTLQNSAIIGRTQFDLLCRRADGYFYSSTWYTGPIAGHPWEVDLVAAGLNTLPGNEEYAWGRHMEQGGLLNCLNVGHLFSARQVGNTLSIVNYLNDTVINCQFTLFKQP
ncbi:MAG: hypothetical protein ACOZJX_14565 [Pseudomonadota bacterium]